MKKRNKSEWEQLELPLFQTKFKVGKKVKIVGLDSTGGWDLRGKFARIFTISSEGYLLKIPLKQKGLNFFLLEYSFWDIEL